MKTHTWLKLTLLFVGITPAIILSGQSPIPTWNQNISCIVQTHCASCHNPSGIAPFSLQHYSEAAPLASAMSYMVTERLMPPWRPDPKFNHFVGERVLSSDEISLIQRWAGYGAPEGDSLPMEVEVFTNSWQLPNPDLSLRIEDFTIPVTPPGYELHQCFVLKTGLTKDKIIQAIEVVPGSRGAVHHAHVRLDFTDNSAISDSIYPGPGFQCQEGSNPIYSYGPSATPAVFPEGMGIPLPVGADVVLSIHYPSAAGLTDSTRVNFFFADSEDAREIRNLPLLSHETNIVNGPLFIPADSFRTFYETTVIPKDVTIMGIFPHAHRICEEMTAIAKPPDGPPQVLVKIDQWDPAWQGFYFYASPKVFPAGTRISGQAVYNNTDSNPRNPFSPPQDISQFGGSLGEMMIFGFMLLPSELGDGDIIMDSLLPTEYYMDCNPLSNLFARTAEPRTEYIVQPNPASTYIVVKEIGGDGTKKQVFRLFTLNGTEVKKERMLDGQMKTALDADIPDGIYFYSVEGLDGKVFSNGKIVVQR